MSIKISIPIFFLIIILISCSAGGYTSDFEKLDSVQQSKIKKLQSFANHDTNLIYKISGKQLHEELKKHPKSIVYIFKNGCSSKFCLPLSIYENYAKENNYKLFLVMNGYIHLEETTKQPLKNQLYSIDYECYNTNIRQIYSTYFINEIQNKTMSNKNSEYQGNIFIFEYEQLKKVLLLLPN